MKVSPYILMLLALSAPLEAQAQVLTGHWQVRARAVGVIPEDDDASVNIGGTAEAGDAITPEIDITYFFNDHIGMELIAATSKHQVDYFTGANLGEAWILPPTLTLQYHFNRENAFSPYVGAGLNYSWFYGEDAGTGFTDLDIEGGLGYALQAGADYWLDDHWGLNLDVKKLWLDVDVKLNNGTITSDVDLDPWIIGGGISYRFE